MFESIVSFQELFIRYGGKLLARHRVTEIIPGDLITVQTDKGTFMAKKVIITAGAWTGKLVEGTGLTLPLKVIDSYTCIYTTHKYIICRGLGKIFIFNVYVTA